MKCSKNSKEQSEQENKILECRVKKGMMSFIG